MAKGFYDASLGVEITLSMFDTVAALSNLAILVLILRKENLRTVSNLLVAALLSSELLVSAVIVPLSIAAYGQRSWPFSDGLCVFHGFLYNTLYLISGTLISVISVDRFYSLSSPMGHVAYLTEKTTMWTIIVIVLHSGLLSSFPLFGIGDLSYTFLEYQTRCGIDWTLGGAYGVYYFILFIASFTLPFVGITIMYAKSFQSARESARKIRPGNIRIQTLQDGQFTSVAHQDSFDCLKANVTVFTIIGSFVASRGPMTICDLAAWIRGDNFCSPMTELTVAWMLYLGPLVNPYVYTLLNRRLRKELVQTIKGLVRCGKTASEEEPKDILDYLRNITDRATPEPSTSRSNSGAASTQTRLSCQFQHQHDNDRVQQNGLQLPVNNNNTEPIPENINDPEPIPENNNSPEPIPENNNSPEHIPENNNSPEPIPENNNSPEHITENNNSPEHITENNNSPEHIPENNNSPEHITENNLNLVEPSPEIQDLTLP